MNSDICPKRYIKLAVYMEHKKKRIIVSYHRVPRRRMDCIDLRRKLIIRSRDMMTGSRSCVRGVYIRSHPSRSISDGQRRPAGPAGRPVMAQRWLNCARDAFWPHNERMHA